MLVTTCAFAQGTSEFTLFENIVHFKAPADWQVMMEKKEGNPQFIAFQVKDPADAGTGTTTQVTVNTKVLNDSASLQSEADAALRKAKELPGFEQRSEGVEPTVLRFYAMNEKTQYENRETFYLKSHVLIHVRCSRPVLAATTREWTAAYEKGCADIMQALKPH